MTKILSYQGIITKEEFVAELKKHQEADNFIKGTYGEKIDGQFKACAVGCSLESIARIKKIEMDTSDHSKYPELLGIPEWLGRVEDTIFESLSESRSKSWPVEFSEAIPENVDLESVKAPFLICVLERALTTFDHTKFTDVKSSVDRVIHLYKTGGGLEDFRAAGSTAFDAARAAVFAAAESESAAAAARSAAYAARSAANSVRYAAFAAAADAGNSFRYAAFAGARSAAAGAAATARAAAAATYEYFADQLLEMLRGCK